MEIQNTSFDKIEWKLEGALLSGYGIIDNVNIKVILDPITYGSMNGINVTFAVLQGIKYEESFTDKNTLISAKIIGCVTNAIKSQLTNFNWDFISVISKDNIESRFKLYLRISNRISRELGLSVLEIDKNKAKILVLSKLSNEELSLIKDKIENS